MSKAVTGRVRSETEAESEMEVGSLAYWKPGSAFCILFGPTSASTGEKPVLANPGNYLGKVLGDAAAFRRVPTGAMVRLEKGEGLRS